MIKFYLKKMNQLPSRCWKFSNKVPNFIFSACWINSSLSCLSPSRAFCLCNFCHLLNAGGASVARSSQSPPPAILQGLWGQNLASCSPIQPMWLVSLLNHLSELWPIKLNNRNSWDWACPGSFFYCLSISYDPGDETDEEAWGKFSPLASPLTSAWNSPMSLIAS